MTSSYPFTPDDLETLRQWDTPTICNGLEEIVPERRAIGFTVEPMAVLHPDPEAPPIIGLARTGTVRAKEPPRGSVANRLDWYEYVADASLPTVVVLQDIDDRPGYGAFWGEVNTNIHMSLGAVGCVTNGSFRDLAASAKNFQIVGGRVGPSHAHIHVVDFGRPVNVFGMQAAHDDVIHADCHGAVVIPADCVTKLPAVIDLLARREKVILDLCASPDFTPAKLREAFAKSRDIH
jgi:regulator of RNase E activity RraA